MHKPRTSWPETAALQPWISLLGSILCLIRKMSINLKWKPPQPLDFLTHPSTLCTQRHRSQTKEKKDNAFFLKKICSVFCITFYLSKWCAFFFFFLSGIKFIYKYIYQILCSDSLNLVAEGCTGKVKSHFSWGNSLMTKGNKSSSGLNTGNPCFNPGVNSDLKGLSTTDLWVSSLQTYTTRNQACFRGGFY